MQSEQASAATRDAVGDGLNSAPPSTDPALSAPGSTPPSGRVIVTLGDSPPTAPDDKTVITNRPLASDAPPPVLHTPQHIGAALVGKQLDHYELIEFVGGGGMGAVFRATDTRLGRIVAVKVLSRDQSDEETIRRFRNEAQSAARLDHPNIARVYFVGEASGWNYIVFEFIEGTNLRDLVDERGPLSLADALSFTLQIAEALEHSSSRDVVHRDIKPSNVLIMAGGQAKLVDMGLARLHQVESSSDDLTASGVTLGTFDYISPEQARDPRAADVRSDIYSLGCTLYYMLTGQPPFPDGTALQKLLRHNAEVPPDVRLFRPELNPLVSGLLTKMLEKRPGQRFQSPQELIAELASLAQKLGIPALSQRGRVVLKAAHDPHQWRTAAWQVAAAVGLLAVAVVVVDAVLSSGNHPAGEVILRPKLAAPQPAASSPSDSSTSPGAPGSPATTSPSGAPSSESSASPGVATTAPMSAGPEGASVPASASATSANVATSADEPGSTAVDPAPAGTALEGESRQGFALEAPAAAANVELTPQLVALGGGAELSAALSLPPPPRKVDRLIVAAQAPTNVPPGTEYATTLAAACRRAAELGLTEIDLQWTGRQIEQPLEIAGQRLTLRAAMGYRPIVVFRPALTGLEPDWQMIRMAGGSSSRLAIEGVELRLELPAEPASASSGWSLVSMQTGQTLELSDCVLTVQNAGEIHDRVAMITVQSRRASDTMSMPEVQPSMAPSTTLSLHQCIARGEATFVSLTEESPLTIHWNQGLLVTPRRLIETGGSLSKPEWYEEIKVSLIRVTASCRQGLYQMKRRPGAAFQFALDVTADHCVVMTDPTSALYEFIGVTETALGKKHLQCRGSGNLLARPDMVFLRFGPGSPQAMQEYRFEDRDLWSDEEALPRIPWRREPDLTMPAHLQVKSAFELNANEAMAADAGFDPAELPAIVPAPADVVPPKPAPPSATSLESPAATTDSSTSAEPAP